MRFLQTVLSGVIALASLANGGVFAQESAAAKQERARLRFETLHESMQRLQVALAETSPDESKVLEVGNHFVQESRIRQQMDEVKTLLRDGKWDEALGQMNGVDEHLRTLLNLLLNRDMDLKELLEEIARLEAFKERVDKLIEEQQAEKEASAKNEALQQHLEQIEKAKAELERLIEDQQGVRKQANDAGLSATADAAKEMEAREGELKADAEDLSGKMRDLEQKHGELKEPAKAGEPKDGEPKDSAPGEGASGAGQCSGSCQGASAAMGKAQQKLQQNRPERSLEDMDQALKQLDEAKRALEAMAEEARRELMQLPFEQLERTQETTRIDTDKLAQDMEKAGQGEDGQQKKETPGTPNVQQAVPKQKAAAGMLKDHKPGKAKQDQQDAKEDLEAAKKKLEDALAQLRQQLQDEVLRALEERFGAMLAKQKELSARTIVTDRLRGEALTADGSLPAALVTRCGELSTGETELASEAGDALKLLEEEGTTAVFPEIVAELKVDLEGVAGRLGGQDTGAVTQAKQADIEETLRMLIDSLRRMIEDGDGQCQGSCNGEPPLVPLSAELKMILALQKRVHGQTKTYDAQTTEPQRATDAARTEAGEIARKQGRVKDLTRKLAVQLNKENQAEENR